MGSASSRFGGSGGRDVGQPRHGLRRPRLRIRRLHVEVLEDRRMLSGLELLKVGHFNDEDGDLLGDVGETIS